MPAFIDRTGEKNFNNFGSEMKIIEYSNNKNIIVKFIKSGYTVKSNYTSFKNGTIRSVYDKTVYGIGFLGEGIHKYTIDGKNTPKYKTWHGMLRRCFDENFKRKRPTYKDCVVTEAWLNFQKFGEWYDQNYYEVKGEKMHLDKDILVKGNKLYSPETCIFVPAYINSLFASLGVTHGKYSPLIYDSGYKINKYSVRTREEHIGNYNTLEEAFTAYRRHKELTIRDVANEYKEKIPEKLYDAMLNYKIEPKKDLSKLNFN